MLDATAELGILGVSIRTREDRGGGVIDEVRRGRAAFAASIGTTLSLRTAASNEIFLDVRLRYLSADLDTGISGSEGEIAFALGYRFVL